MQNKIVYNINYKQIECTVKADKKSKSLWKTFFEIISKFILKRK